VSSRLVGQYDRCGRRCSGKTARGGGVGDRGRRGGPVRAAEELPCGWHSRTHGAEHKWLGICFQKFPPRLQNFELKYKAAGSEMVNNFCYWNLVLFKTNFGLKFRFFPGFEFGKAGDLSQLCTLMQIQQCQNLVKKFTNLTYKYSSLILLTCIDQLSILKRI
jgi:hypothetical protein